MKAILEIYAPETCAVCKLRYDNMCVHQKQPISINEGLAGRATFCPLRIVEEDASG